MWFPLGIEYPAPDPFSIRNHRDLNVSFGDQSFEKLSAASLFTRRLT